jgi:uncharacterized protein (TIGR02996 family)
MSGDTARGFLEDIVAHPDEDAPRLIFADWLDENGDADRAEFIRVQVERARLPEWDARQVRLRLREQELIKKHWREWKKELPRIRGVTWEGFRRGFVASAKFFSFAVLRAKASACWAATPVEAVTIRWPRRNEGVESIAPIAGLRELSINATAVDRREVGLLAEAPLLSTLRALNIRDCGLGVEGFRSLVASPRLGNLTALRMPSNSIGNGGISALFEATSLTSLEELDLSESEHYGRYGEDPVIEASGMEALAAWPGMTRLRSLSLSGNDVRRRGLRALLRSPRAGGLKRLILRTAGLNGQAMQEFGSAGQGMQLDVLDLGGNLLTDLGAAYLARAACLRELKELQLDECEMGLEGARELARAPFLASLRRLNVNYNSFGPEGLNALLEKQPSQLHTLQMTANDLGDEGVAYLAESPASDTLQELDLRLNGLWKPSVKALANAKHLRALVVLRLNDNRILKSAAAPLLASPLGERLAILEV